MNILEAFEKSNKIDNRPRDITLEIDKRGDLFVHHFKRFGINDIMSNDWQPVIETLTFEKIKAKCVAGESLLVDGEGYKRLYLGFNRVGALVTDAKLGNECSLWYEGEIKDWKISDEKWDGE